LPFCILIEAYSLEKTALMLETKALASLKRGLNLSKKLQKLKVSKYSVASHRLRNYRFLRVETLNLRGNGERDNL
jgi:hypothetical protein